MIEIRQERKEKNYAKLLARSETQFAAAKRRRNGLNKKKTRNETSEIAQKRNMEK